MGTLRWGHSPPIYRHLVCELFIKILINMSLSINVYKSYVYDHLSLYISLVNNSVDPKKPY